MTGADGDENVEKTSVFFSLFSGVRCVRGWLLGILVSEVVVEIVGRFKRGAGRFDNRKVVMKAASTFDFLL